MSRSSRSKASCLRCAGGRADGVIWSSLLPGPPLRDDGRSRLLQEPDHVAICIFHGCDQLAPADISDRLHLFCAGAEQQLQTILDVVDLPEADGPRHTLAVAFGVQTQLLLSDPEPDVVRLVRVRLDPQELAVQRLRLSEILDGNDEG